MSQKKIQAVTGAFGYSGKYITREEIEGLMGELLYVDAPPLGKTKLTDWAKEHANTLGKKYTSEMARRKNRNSVYNSN